MIVPITLTLLRLNGPLPLPPLEVTGGYLLSPPGTQSAAQPLWPKAWRLEGRLGPVEWGAGSGSTSFYSMRGVFGLLKSHDFIRESHYLDLKIRPWSGRFRWEALSVQTTLHLVHSPEDPQSENPSNFLCQSNVMFCGDMRSLPPVSFKLGASVEVIELARGEPTPFKIELGAGITNAQIQESKARPQFFNPEEFSTYVSVEVHWALQDRLDSYVGVAWMPQTDPTKLENSSFYVPNFGLIYRF